MNTRCVSRALFVACALLLGLKNGPAHAETLSTSIQASTIQAAWTTCPTNPNFDTDCNYTVVYSGRAANVKPFTIIVLANARVHPGGSAEVLASGFGYAQPATVSIARASLATGSSSGSVYIYGYCGDPNNLSSCYYLGTASLSATLSASDGTTAWNQSQGFTAPVNIKYSSKSDGAWRPAGALGSARFNGYTWALGRSVGAQIARFNMSESLTCSGKCPQATATLAAAAASSSPGQTLQSTEASGSVAGNPKAPPAPPAIRGLQDMGESTAKVTQSELYPYGFGGNLGGYDFAGSIGGYTSVPLPIVVDPYQVGAFFNIVNPYINTWSVSGSVYDRLGSLSNLVLSLSCFVPGRC